MTSGDSKDPIRPEAAFVPPRWSAEEKALRADFGPDVAGVDEAGRGPLAGPVVAAAVILPDTPLPPEITDSKLLSESRRFRLAEILRNLPGIRIGTGIVTAEEIDRLDILRAAWQAMRAALLALDPPAACALIDGSPIPPSELPVPARCVPKADKNCLCVSAASIIAKVTRDRIMIEMDRKYPGYGFARHKGYGTREHIEALARLGPCPIHRRSFAPVAQVIEGAPRQLLLDLPFDAADSPPLRSDDTHS